MMLIAAAPLDVATAKSSSMARSLAMT